MPSGGAVAGPELSDDALNVGADGTRAEDQFLCYLPVGLSLGHESQNIELAGCQGFEQRRRPLYVRVFQS